MPAEGRARPAIPSNSQPFGRGQGWEGVGARSASPQTATPGVKVCSRVVLCTPEKYIS